MPLNSRLLTSCVLVSGLVYFSVSALAVVAQTVKRHPDGTVEVSDDDQGASPQRSARSSSKSSKGASSAKHSSSNVRIPAYTKRMGGVTVHRNANGTVEVTDNDMKTTWSGGSKPSSSKKSGKSIAAKKKK